MFHLLTRVCARAGFDLLNSFIRLMWLSGGACPVTVTEREIRVRTQQTVLNFCPRVQLVSSPDPTLSRAQGGHETSVQHPRSYLNATMYLVSRPPRVRLLVRGWGLGTRLLCT